MFLMSVRTNTKIVRITKSRIFKAKSSRNVWVIIRILMMVIVKLVGILF